MNELSELEKKIFQRELEKWEASCMAEINMGELLDDMYKDFIKNHPDEVIDSQ